MSTIANQVDEFNVGFTEAVGPQNAGVFAEEQAALNGAGLPDDVVREGDTLPDAQLVTAAGEQTVLSAQLAGRPTVLVFFRGVWCPYCNITLRTYQAELLPALTERGVGLVAISPQSVEATGKTETDWELQFPALSDPGNAFAGGLGIVTAPSADAQEAHHRLGFDVKNSNADDTHGIPFPTVLLVGGDRVVRFADVHVDYTTRTEVADILAAADRL